MQLLPEAIGVNWNRAVRKAEMLARINYLKWNNGFSRAHLTATKGPVVCLTTYGARAATVYLAIESIASGTRRPSRMILWIDECHLFHNLPRELRRLQERGLEIRLCENVGPHKKYHPYVQSEPDFQLPLVTADDDILYPSYWLSKLIDAYERRSDIVNCYRARHVRMTDSGLAPYETWTLVDTTQPSFSHMAVGVGGVIYPARMQQRLRREGSAFMQSCPGADDIWLHVAALREGMKIRQIEASCFDLMYVPGSQQSALHVQNIDGGANDLQISQTYRKSDIEIIRDDQNTETNATRDWKCSCESILYKYMPHHSS
jgi:hypothetical protein